MTTRDWIGPKEIGRLLEVTDSLGLHREAVRVPLDTEPGGRVAVESSKLVVAAPRDGDFEAFVGDLPERIRATPGVERLKRA